VPKEVITYSTLEAPWRSVLWSCPTKRKQDCGGTSAACSCPNDDDDTFEIFGCPSWRIYTREKCNTHLLKSISVKERTTVACISGHAGIPYHQESLMKRFFRRIFTQILKEQTGMLMIRRMF